MTFAQLQLNVILKNAVQENGLCALQYTITDLETNQVLANESDPITIAHNTTVPINVTNLKPFTKYKCDAAIVCGEGGTESSDCPPVTRTIPMYTFKTAEGLPGKQFVFIQALFVTF